MNDVSAEILAAIRTMYVWGARSHVTAVKAIVEKFGLDTKIVESIINGTSDQDNDARSAHHSDAMKRVWKRRALLAALDRRA